MNKIFVIIGLFFIYLYYPIVEAFELKSFNMIIESYTNNWVDLKKDVQKIWKSE